RRSRTVAYRRPVTPCPGAPMPLLSHSRQAGLVAQILPSLAIAVIVGLFAFSLVVPMAPADAGAQTAFAAPQEPKKARGHAGATQAPGSQSPAVDPAANSGAAKGILTPANNRPEVDPMVAHDGAPFFPSRANTGGQHLTPDMFTKPEACKECHAEIYQQWSASIMGHSWRDPIYRALLKLSSQATHGAVDRFCIGCHSPIGLVTGTADAVKGDIGVECS